jgi:hypothetical protein
MEESKDGQSEQTIHSGLRAAYHPSMPLEEVPPEVSPGPVIAPAMASKHSFLESIHLNSNNSAWSEPEKMPKKCSGI